MASRSPRTVCPYTCSVGRKYWRLSAQPIRPIKAKKLIQVRTGHLHRIAYSAAASLTRPTQSGLEKVTRFVASRRESEPVDPAVAAARADGRPVRIRGAHL